MLYKERKQIKTRGKEMGKIVGYVRVSSKDQNADRQMDEMEKRGVLRNISIWTRKAAAILNGHPIEK